MGHRFLYDLLVITLALASGVLLLLSVSAYVSNFVVMAVEALLGSLFVCVCLFYTVRWIDRANERLRTIKELSER